MSDKLDDAMLVTITTDTKFQKRSDSLSRLGSRKSISNKLKNSELNANRHDEGDTFFMYSDEGGKKRFSEMKLTKSRRSSAPSGEKKAKTISKIKPVKVDELRSDSYSNRSSEDTIFGEKAEEKNHISFTEFEEFSVGADNERNQITSEIETKYYLDYDGKLSTIQKKSVAKGNKLFDSECFEVPMLILDEIITRAVENSAKQVPITVQKSVTLSEFQSTSCASTRDRIKMKNKNTTLATEKKSKSKRVHIIAPDLGTTVKHLGLPIQICKPQLFMDPRVNLEYVEVTDTILTTISDVSERKIKERELDQEIETPSVSEEEDEEEKEIKFNSPYEMSWCFGFNPEVPILNLSTSDQSVIMFATSQFAVLHNFHAGTMNFLQGHLNKVTCLASDSTGSLLVSADSGENSRVVIWDFGTLSVLEILKNVHPRGTELLAMSTEGEYLVTVSPSPQQYVQLWRWRSDKDNSSAERYFNENLGQINKLTVNPSCQEEFALIFETGVTFVLYDKDKEVGTENGEELVFDNHPFPSKVGKFTDTTFLTGNEITALSSTTKGYVVVWLQDANSQYKKVQEKHVRLHLDPITHIKAIDNMVVIATINGNISFFDTSLTVIYWARKLQLGPLVSLSFNLFSQYSDKMICNKASHRSCAVSWRAEDKTLYDASLNNYPIPIRHFIISTVTGKVAYFNTTSGVPKPLLYPSDGIYTAIDVLPNSQYLCAGTSQGQCHLFDIDQHKIKVTQMLPTQEQTCPAISYLRYSPSGFVLACGMYSGHVWLLDPLFLKPKSNIPLYDSEDCISLMTFSNDSNYLAIADLGMCVTVYNLENEVKLVGQYEVHSKPIVEVFFTSTNSTEKNLNLFTLGRDHTLVQFIISTNENTLILKDVHRVEQSAVPTSIMSYPPLEDYFLMVNSEMKFKLLSGQNLKCTQTLHAPNLGYPINYLECFPGNRQQYMLFGTDHHLGLHILPICGNPYKALACWASPTKIICSRVHSSGKYVFTVSENSSTIKMWQVNLPAVDEFYCSGGGGLDPFLSLLEGGKGGWQEKDLREFFLVGQFMHQGEKPSIVREVTNSLHACEIINIFQALGFFPTKQQVENIVHEVTSKGQLTQQTIGFEDFVRLFVNHQPNFALTVADLNQAFQYFYQGTHFTSQDSNIVKLVSEPVFESTTFVEKLMSNGEAMVFPEIYFALSVLAEGKVNIQEQNHSPSFNFMPQELSFKTFLNDLLGFRYEDF